MGSLNELQTVELDILVAFSRVCAREGFTWYAMFGTLLGAVRHGGFIPWDNDIDVVMPREDYDYLRARPELFCEPYFLQTPQNDPSATPRFMRLRRSDTTVMKGFPNGLTRGGHMGAFIDILPLDNVPSAKKAKQLRSIATAIQGQMRASAALDESLDGELPDWKAAYCYGLGGIAGCYALLAERYELFCATYNEGAYCAMPVLGGERGGKVYDRQWFQGREIMSFEGVNIPVPSGWREVLVAAYPDGLLEPEEDERELDKYADKTIIDMHRPYKSYTARYTDMLVGIDGKRVLIFGAGDSLRIWMERYSNGLEVVCVFDNAPAKWGTVAYNLTVHPPGKLPSFIGKDTRLIIASLWNREIAQQLEHMGINDFSIFIDGLNYKKG